MGTISRLAVEGGEPVRVLPPPPWPVFAADEIAAVVGVLESGKVNQWTGTLVGLFERQFAELHDMPFSIAVANGSVALEAVLRAYRIGEGDEVIVTPRSFIASASCVDFVGAKPVFADIDLNSEAITPATVRPLINERTKAIIVVHLNGHPADMPGFMQLAREYGIVVIEDCAQAHGARIDGRLVGSFGHASAFSFCQDKIITIGGEGGMVLFKDEAIWKRAWSYRDHGKDYDLTRDASGDGFRWLCSGLGSNLRLTEMQAAIGLRQLTKFSSWVAARQANAGQITRLLKGFPSVLIPEMPSNQEHSFYRLSFRVDPAFLKSGWSRDRISKTLNAEGIPCRSGSCPEIYRERAYAERFSGFSPLPNAAYLGTVSLALPVHPTLDKQYMDDCARAIEKVFSVATNFTRPR